MTPGADHWRPAPSAATLIPPIRSHRFFSYAQHHRFEPRASGFSATNAAWLADLSLLAYDDPPRVAAAVAAAGLALPGRQPITRADMASAQAYVAHDERVVLVAFRGSEMPVRSSTRGFLWKSIDAVRDILTNARLGFADTADGVQVHRGFQMALQAIWPQLLDGWLGPLGPGREVWFTGHSQGAAMALLAARAYPGCRGVYTFGAPRIGTAGLAAGLPSGAAFRIVHGADLITSVPPADADPRLAWVPPGYTHVGTGVGIDRSGHFDFRPVWDHATPAALVELAAGLSDPAAMLDVGASGPWRGLLGALRSGEARRETRMLLQALYDHAPLYYALGARHAAGCGADDPGQSGEPAGVP